MSTSLDEGLRLIGRPDAPMQSRHEAAADVLRTLFAAWDRKVAPRGGPLASDPELRQDIVHTVFAKLLQMSTDDALPDLPNPRAYLATCVRNAFVDHARKHNRDRRNDDVYEAPDLESSGMLDDAEANALLGEVQEVLEVVADAAILARPAHHRAAGQEAWDDLRGMVFHGHTMHDVILRREGITKADGPEAWKKAQGRILRSQSRFRRALSEAAASIGGDVATLFAAHELRLVRRQGDA